MTIMAVLGTAHLHRHQSRMGKQTRAVHPSNSSDWRLTQEVEVTSELRPEDVLRIQPRVAPRGRCGPGRDPKRRRSRSGSDSSTSRRRSFTLTRILSPDRTSPSGQPITHSGETWRMTVPNAVPLMRASEIRSMSFTPARASLAGMGRYPASGIPAPIGPAFCSTSVSSGCTSRSGSSMRAARSSRFLKTTARPTCSKRRSSAAAHLRIDPFGARLPNRASSPPLR